MKLWLMRSQLAEREENWSEEGLAGRHKVPGHMGLYKGCTVFSTVKMEAIGRFITGVAT